MSGGPASLNIKIALLVVAIIIAVATLYYTQNLVRKLQEKERQIVELYAKGIEYVANTSSLDVDITFLFDNIIKPIDFPLILTNLNNKVNLESRTDVRNITYDTTKSKKELETFFDSMIKEMDSQHSPILVTYQDSIVLTKIHYGDSELITQLKFYPYLQIITIILYFLLLVDMGRIPLLISGAFLLFSAIWYRLFTSGQIR